MSKSTNIIKAVLLNDTSVYNHHGCKLVVEQIFKQCSTIGIDIIHSIKFKEDWNKPRHLKKIKNANIVIVNGEGTLHHSSSNKRVADLVSIAKYCRGIGVIPFLINSVYQDNNDYLADCMKSFELIFVRESNSKKELNKFDIESIIVPDMIFSLSHNFCLTGSNRKKGIIFTDSVNKSTSNMLFEKYKDNNNARFLTLKVNSEKRYYTQSKARHKIKKIIKKMRVATCEIFAPRNWHGEINKNNNYPNVNDIYNIKNRVELFNIIAGAELIITGRFHMVCLAMLAKTPFIALPSNTFKIEGMLKDAGLSHRFMMDNDFANQLHLFSEWQDSEKEKLEKYLSIARRDINKMFLRIREAAV